MAGDLSWQYLRLLMLGMWDLKLLYGTTARFRMTSSTWDATTVSARYKRTTSRVTNNHALVSSSNRNVTFLLKLTDPGTFAVRMEGIVRRSVALYKPHARSASESRTCFHETCPVRSSKPGIFVCLGR